FPKKQGVFPNNSRRNPEEMGCFPEETSNKTRRFPERSSNASRSCLGAVCHRSGKQVEAFGQGISGTGSSEDYFLCIIAHIRAYFMRNYAYPRIFYAKLCISIHIVIMDLRWCGF